MDDGNFGNFLVVPKPISEFWLLCAVKENPYQQCGELEDLPRHKDSPKNPKKKLDDAFDHHKCILYCAA